MNLKEIVEALEQYVDENIESDDIDFSYIEQLLTEKKDKIDGYAYVHEKLQLEMVAVKAQLEFIKERYEKKLRSLEVAKLNLEQRLLAYHAQDLLSDKEKGNNYTLQFRNFPVVKVNVKVDDLPEEFKDTKVTVKPKLNDIKKALKETPEEIAFMAELEDNYKAQFKLN